MLRYRLRTLLVILALGPPVLAGAWWHSPLVERFLPWTIAALILVVASRRLPSRKL